MKYGIDMIRVKYVFHKIIVTIITVVPTILNNCIDTNKSLTDHAIISGRDNFTIYLSETTIGIGSRKLYKIFLVT